MTESPAISLDSEILSNIGICALFHLVLLSCSDSTGHSSYFEVELIVQNRIFFFYSLVAEDSICFFRKNNIIKHNYYKDNLQA